MEDKILNEITSFCEECNSKDCCPESDCVLFRIEQIVLEKEQQEEPEED